MANYYRRFIPDYSFHVRPLIDLTKKGKTFAWTTACQDVFLHIKTVLSSPKVMAHPQDNGHFILDCDASEVSIGAVLSQVQNNMERVIAYGSKSLSKAEYNYCVTDRELLAVRYFTEYYRCYLLGQEFTVRTDHQALKWLFTMKQPKNRVARWIESLSEFHFTIEYRAGEKHGNADSMSRCPNPWTCECKDFSKLRCGPCKKCLRKNELMCGTLDSQGTVDDLSDMKKDTSLPDQVSVSKQENPDLAEAKETDVSKSETPYVRISKGDLRNA